MKCNNCGKKIRIDDKFCSKCGTQIDWMQEEYNEIPEEAKETRGRKASKWVTLGVTAAIGIAAVFTITIIGNAVHKNITAEPTDVANETEATTETETTTTQPTTTTEPETTTTYEPETTESRKRSRGYDDYNDNSNSGYGNSDNDSYNYNYNDDYDYDENYADGWRRATDDYEGNGVADDIWDYLRTRGGQIRDSFENIQNRFY